MSKHNGIVGSQNSYYGRKDKYRTEKEKILLYLVGII